jgi:hypothetical protein
MTVPGSPSRPPGRLTSDNHCSNGSRCIHTDSAPATPAAAMTVPKQFGSLAGAKVPDNVRAPGRMFAAEAQVRSGTSSCRLGRRPSSMWSLSTLASRPASIEGHQTNRCPSACPRTLSPNTAAHDLTPGTTPRAPAEHGPTRPFRPGKRKELRFAQPRTADTPGRAIDLEGVPQCSGHQASVHPQTERCGQTGVDEERLLNWCEPLHPALDEIPRNLNVQCTHAWHHRAPHGHVRAMVPRATGACDVLTRVLVIDTCGHGPPGIGRPG